MQPVQNFPVFRVPTFVVHGALFIFGSCSEAAVAGLAVRFTLPMQPPDMFHASPRSGHPVPTDWHRHRAASTAPSPSFRIGTRCSGFGRGGSDCHAGRRGPFSRAFDRSINSRPCPIPPCRQRNRLDQSSAAFTASEAERDFSAPDAAFLHVSNPAQNCRSCPFEVGVQQVAPEGREAHLVARQAVGHRRVQHLHRA